MALVGSNDTDLGLPVALAPDGSPVTVGVAAPLCFKNRCPIADLENAANFTAHITEANRSCLKACQFPEHVEVGGEMVSCPEARRPASIQDTTGSSGARHLSHGRRQIPVNADLPTLSFRPSYVPTRWAVRGRLTRLLRR